MIFTTAPPCGAGPRIPRYTVASTSTPVVGIELKAVGYTVKRKNGSAVEEARVWMAATRDDWNLLKQTPAQLNGKEVIVTGQLALLPKGRDSVIPEGAMYFLGRFDIKPAPASK